MSNSKKMVIDLRITILTHHNEDEDDVVKHLSNILFDRDSDIEDVEAIS